MYQSWNHYLTLLSYYVLTYIIIIIYLLSFLSVFYACFQLSFAFDFRNWFTEVFSGANSVAHSQHDMTVNIVLSLCFFLISVTFLGMTFIYDIICYSGQCLTKFSSIWCVT